jgi:thioredoxin reductase (NADPH)
MFVRKDEMRASKIMQMRVLETKNIKVYWNTEVEEIIGKERTEAVRVVNNNSGEKTEIPVSAYFVTIGHQPNSEIFKGWLEMDEAGYIKTLPDSTKTNIEGVFAAGDLQDKIFRQAVTAAGSGCMAALEAERFLSMLEHPVRSDHFQAFPEKTE